MHRHRGKPAAAKRSHNRSGQAHPARRHGHSHSQGPARHQRPSPPANLHDTGPIVATSHADGVLELNSKGFGFLRNPAKNYAMHTTDPFVSETLVGKYRLAAGLRLAGPVGQGSRGPGGPRLVDVETIEGADPAAYKRRSFDELTPVDPHEWLRLETGAEPLTTRVIDLLTPIGKGQRGLIVAAPRTGKTMLLQQVALAIAKNHPNMKLIMLLVDERPEEVTEMRRTVGVSKPHEPAEVIYSSSDHDAAQHVRLAELVMERAKRLTEQGKQVFVLLDSLTRLARAYNKQVGTSGRTMTGGIDIRALEVPKRLFGQARVFDEGGSLTILGTSLIETGSRMDDIIFQEFKGTGNMELVLDRKLAERRIFPAMDISQSGTRKEERLLPADMLKRITLLRRTLVSMKPVTAMESLVRVLEKYPTNADFLNHVGEFDR